MNIFDEYLINIRFGESYVNLYLEAYHRNENISDVNNWVHNDGRAQVFKSHDIYYMPCPAS